MSSSFEATGRNEGDSTEEEQMEFSLLIRAGAAIVGSFLDLGQRTVNFSHKILNIAHGISIQEPSTGCTQNQLGPDPWVTKLPR